MRSFYLKTIAVGAVIIAQAFPATAQAVQRPEWPTVNSSQTCQLRWSNGVSRTAFSTFTKLDGLPHHRLRRGTAELRFLQVGGALDPPLSQPPFTDDFHLVYKPSETRQDRAGTTFELTVPNEIQCKRFTVKTKNLGEGRCLEEHIYRGCDGGFQKECFVSRRCN